MRRACAAAAVLLLLLGTPWTLLSGQEPQPGEVTQQLKGEGTPPRREDAEALVIGSKNFTENRLLAEIMAQLIESRTDIPVEREINLGGTMVVFGALKNGEIDLYPEYTGTGWAIVLKREEKVKEPLRAYTIVANGYRENFGIEWLSPFGFENSYALAMRDDVAEELGVSTISDIVPYGDRLTAGLSHEFLNREDGWEPLKAAYGLEVADVRGMEHGLAYEAIDAGRTDLIDTWTTDGKLLKFPIRILHDDKDFFPPYDAAPIIRLEVLERHPELRPLLNTLAFRLPDERMRELNNAVEVAERSFQEVARAFLEEEGLIGEGAPPLEAGLGDRSKGFFAFMAGRMGRTFQLTLDHLLLTAIAVGGAIVLAVPLGIFLTRYEALANPVMQATGVIQTVPSLALLVFMIPILGLGMGAALAALFLYALLPIVRNTYTGINEVEPDLLEAAAGMGLTDRQSLVLVELPLATRTIMAGIRTATVINIGIATLAAFIGAGGLGEPIVTGLQLNDMNMVISGALPAAVLAILVDWLLGFVEKRLTRRP